jgi:hypothetical protein
MKRRNNAIDNGVSLCLFDPIAYNSIWHNSKLKSGCALSNNLYLPELMPLPNLSMTYNSNQFAAYALGDPNNRQCKGDKAYCLGCKFQDPVAILTSQSNVRIRTQAGTFLAFPLHKVTKLSKEFLNETSLESIQEKLLYGSTSSGKKQFLYKIIVKGKALKELTEWTLAAGMSTYKTYPDLQNIGLFVKGMTKRMT